jgi:hypothetical protein
MAYQIAQGPPNHTSFGHKGSRYHVRLGLPSPTGISASTIYLGTGFSNSYRVNHLGLPGSPWAVSTVALWHCCLNNGDGSQSVILCDNKATTIPEFAALLPKWAPLMLYVPVTSLFIIVRSCIIIKGFVSSMTMPKSAFASVKWWKFVSPSCNEQSKCAPECAAARTLQLCHPQAVTDVPARYRNSRPLMRNI